MNNCLKIQLNESVNNDNLPFLGKFKFTLSKNLLTGASIVIKSTSNGGKVKITVAGDYTANYNTDYSNTEFEVTASTVEQYVYISSVAGNGYILFELVNLTNPTGIMFLNKNLKCDKSFYSLSLYSPYLLCGALYAQGNMYADNPKMSEWLDLIIQNNVQNNVLQVNNYRTNIKEDSIDLNKFGKLINVNMITNLSTVSYAEVANAMVSVGGRTSGTLQFITSVIVNIKFGTSMVNPTAEDTERGWQIAQ